LLAMSLWLVASVSARERNRHARQRSSTSSPAIADRQRELKALQQSIAEDRKRITALREQERSTMNAIQQMRRHSANIRRYMVLLEAEIASLQDAADSASMRSATTAENLSRVHGGYAGLARSMSRAASSAAKAPEDAVLLRRITKGARTTSTTLSTQRDSLSAASMELRSRSERRAALLGMKNAEQKELEKMVTMTEKALSSIRSDTRSVAEQLRKNKAGASQVQSAIAGMVAQEQRARREAREGARRERAATAPDRTTGTGFSYPVSGRNVVHGFGTYRNSVTNTMANNPGVDLAAPAGSTVRSIAAGTVTLVSWLPGYMSVVIVDHHNGYRSVYANLASVRVRKGQRIAAQGAVGTSGESFDGEFVHLQVWKDKERINPLSVLR
ncbi:MAG: murein hydrolase activator EnvC family protein, partial [Candidatus Kapaibacterium sp.]